LFPGSKNTTVEAGIQSTTSTPDGTDPDLDKMYLLLEPHLRPATPDGENPQSVALFEEHKQLAQEYFKVSVAAQFAICEDQLDYFRCKLSSRTFHRRKTNYSLLNPKNNKYKGRHLKTYRQKKNR
jgi:hypothetical protein